MSVLVRSLVVSLSSFALVLTGVAGPARAETVDALTLPTAGGCSDLASTTRSLASVFTAAHSGVPSGGTLKVNNATGDLRVSLYPAPAGVPDRSQPLVARTVLSATGGENVLVEYEFAEGGSLVQGQQYALVLEGLGTYWALNSESAPTGGFYEVDGGGWTAYACRPGVSVRVTSGEEVVPLGTASLGCRGVVTTGFLKARTFTPDVDTSVTGGVVDISDSGDGTLTLAIHPVTAGGAPDTSSAPLGSATLPAATPVGLTRYRFATPVPLSADTTYALVLSSSNATGRTYSIRAHDSGDENQVGAWAISGLTGGWINYYCQAHLSISSATNDAPTVPTAAADATGDEGSTLSTSGAFGDPDGDPLTITKVSGAGTVTDNGDGTWGWSLPTGDDGSGTVVVQADDGNGETVTDSFGWAAANVAPTVTLGVQSLATGSCRVGATVSWTDPGTADTFIGSLTLGDGTTGGFSSSAYSVTHAYSSAGTYPVSATVTDDDGGSDTESTTITVKDLPGQVLQPINTDGSSRFKLGSTIPVKVVVRSCAGTVLPTLPITVSLRQINTSGGNQAVNEVASTATPTTGTTMRWDATGQQYVYNLSSKSSQFSAGRPLTAGLYEVKLSSPTFPAPVTQLFRLRK